MNKWIQFFLMACVAGLAACPANLLACAACYGQSNDNIAKGFNWGIFSLLAIVGLVLGVISSFFVVIAKRSATFAADSEAPAAPTPTDAGTPD
jgi:hypothetical protein